ncbi:MAG: enoyl-CoA hydratase/isomerase family protein [Acidobacteria bacterium]|nr:enoyl-CoA hydratase/isomerase family protein [Acidobacteriota bacterium]
MNDGSQLLYTVEGAVALLTLNRPDKRNALNDALIGELKDALRLADASEAVRVVVITGAGADFCSGADLSALQRSARKRLHRLVSLIRYLRMRILRRKWKSTSPNLRGSAAPP